MSADKLLVALDVDSGARALELAAALADIVGGVKIGSRLFTLEGPGLVRELVARGTRVFLDLKYHDIPNVVASAVEAAARTGAFMVTIHTTGGAAMMKAAGEARDSAYRSSGRKSLVIGVTVLTSLDEQALRQTGVERPLLSQVTALAGMAKASGLDGVVCSPHEIAAIRGTCGEEFTIVTPGIRGAAAGAEKNDQMRTMGPGEAIRAGASYLVVGRPIVAAPNPREAAEKIVDELKGLGIRD